MIHLSPAPDVCGFFVRVGRGRQAALKGFAWKTNQVYWLTLIGQKDKHGPYTSKKDLRQCLLCLL